MILISIWCSICARTSNILIKDLESLNGRSDPIIINKAIIDTDSDVLYIGAVNRIYRLTFDLEVQNLTFTGPKNDSQRCNLNAISNPSVCSSPKVLTDNYNKVLLLHKTGSTRRLLTCGSLFQGICESRNFGDLSVNSTYIIAVATNDPGANTVAFVSDVTDPTTSSTMEAVYTASDFFNDTSKDMDGIDVLIRLDFVKAVAIRKLTPLDDSFKLIASDESALKYKKSYIKPSKLRFVTGFTSGIYRYFLMTERVTTDDQGTIKEFIQTRIVHMCQNDLHLRTFVDIPLVCQTGSAEFGVATAARVIRPAQKLRESLKIGASDDVLVVTFRNEEATPSSAVCVYSMPAIQDAVVQNIKGCRSGNITFKQNKFEVNDIQCGARFTDVSTFCKLKGEILHIYYIVQ